MTNSTTLSKASASDGKAIKWSSRNNKTSMYKAEHWYPYYFQERFKEYGQDYRRVFSTPTRLQEVLSIMPGMFPRQRLTESQKLALDTAVVYGNSVLHDANASAEMLFEKCYSKNAFTFGFFMTPFPEETLITAAQIIRSSQYTEHSSVNGTLCDIYTDAFRYFLARSYKLFLEQLNLNMHERFLVKGDKTTIGEEFKATMRYMEDLVETQVFYTKYGQSYLEKLATQNILKLLETGRLDEKTATII